jgi:hypothetical protein
LDSWEERESAFIIIRKVNKFESKKHNISFWSEDLLMIIEVNRPGVAHALSTYLEQSE